MRWVRCCRGWRGGDSVLGWQLPLALGALEEDGDAEVVGNFGLFYRRALGDSGLAGLNIFGDYQDAGADGGFWRWSVGAEYRTAWADIFANRYIPSSEARRSLFSGGREERIAYTAGGYDAEVRLHAPSSRWLEGFAEYSLWEGEYGDADEKGFRYGLRVSPLTGGAADGFHFEADYDNAADGGLGARFSYDWTLGQRPRSRGYSAFDPRGHFFTPVERRHEQKIRVRIRSLERDGLPAVARSVVGGGGACARASGISVNTTLTASVNISLIAEVKAGDYLGVCGALAAGANPDHPGGVDQDWAMHHAAMLSDPAAVSIMILLISVGGDIDATGSFGETPLHKAVGIGRIEAVKFLLDAGANTQIEDIYDFAVLGAAGSWLSHYNHSGALETANQVREIIKILLAYQVTCKPRFFRDRAYSSNPVIMGTCYGHGFSTPLSWSGGGTVYMANGYQGQVSLLNEAASDIGGVNLSATYSRVGESVFQVAERSLAVEESLSAGLYSVTVRVSVKQGRLEPSTLYATFAVSVLSGGGVFTITASPYAEYPEGGGLATFAVSGGGLPEGLSLSYEKAGGSEELTLTADGYARWQRNDSARATVFEGYEMAVRARAPWLAGDLSFSLTVSAACATDAEYGDVNLSYNIFDAAYEQDLNTVCWRIGRDSEAVNSRRSDGISPLHDAIRDLGGDRATLSIDTVNLLLAYGASVNANDVNGKTPLDYMANDSGRHVDVLAHRLRAAGGVCEYYGRFGSLSYPACGLNFKPREFVKSISHGWTESVLSVTVGVAPEAPVAFYELDHSRLMVRKWESEGKQGFEVLPLAGASLLGGEALTASVIVWAAKQTLVASLAVTVNYGGIEALSAADSVFTVAWDYRGDLFTVASGTGDVSLSYALSAAEASAALVSLSPFSSAWRWNGEANEGGLHTVTVLMTLSRAYYATRRETARITVYVAARPEETMLTVSPYAAGGVLTLSHSGLSGLVFEKISGSEELTLSSDGVVGWKSGATVGVNTGHVLGADATMAGMLGTLRFSVTARADCTADANHGNGVGPGRTGGWPDIKLALETSDAAAVCWHINRTGHGVDVPVPGKRNGELPLHIAAERDDVEVAALLLTLGAGKDAGDRYGWTPLHYAAEEGNADVAELLLSVWRANPNLRENLEGQAPLHIAADEGSSETLPILLADSRTLLNIVDEDGDTSLDLAARNEFEEFAGTLRESGGVCFNPDRHEHLCGLRFSPANGDSDGRFPRIQGFIHNSRNSDCGGGV